MSHSIPSKEQFNTKKQEIMNFVLKSNDKDIIAKFTDNPDYLTMTVINMLMDESESDSNMQSTRNQKVHEINDQWFKINTPTNIINKTRHSFNVQAKSRKSIGNLVKEVVGEKYDVELSKEIYDEIELLSLNDETINIIKIDSKDFTKEILQKINDSPYYIKNNLLDLSELNIKNCIFTRYLDQKLFRNAKFVTNAFFFDNQTSELSGDRMKCGDIIYIESDDPLTSFHEIWYILDTDNITLKRIGMTRFGQYIQNPHVIIPGFVSQYLLDPIKAYSSFIHQQCWSNGPNFIEIELEINKNSIMFSHQQRHKSLCNHAQEQNAKRLIASYGWKQPHLQLRGSTYTKNKHDINDMESEEYYTIYVQTDIANYGPVIADCNHPNVEKINFGSIVDPNGDGQMGYIMKYTKDKYNHKVLNEEEVDQLLLSLDENIKINQISNCLKRGIAFGVVIIDKNKGLDTILIDDICTGCKQPLCCSIRDVLYQPDTAEYGHDGDGYIKGAAKCKSDGCWNNYVVSMCGGDMRFDSGKYHNHCTKCPNMGRCVGWNGDKHCEQCGDHIVNNEFDSVLCLNCYVD